MGYGYYVIDGKECGYNVEAVCEEEGCEEEIDRGLAFACGGEPGEGDTYCDGYFCLSHLVITPEGQRCRRCEKLITTTWDDDD